MSLLQELDVKFKVKNFGADKVFVISEKGDHFRKQEFIKAWKWCDLEYEFIDAVMGRDLDIKELVQSGRLESFIDPGGNICKNIVAVALSHNKVYEYALNHSYLFNGNNIMIMEDDARPTQVLIDMIQSDEFNELVKDINKFNFDILWLGRGSYKIKGDYLNDNIQSISRFTSPGAQAYILQLDSLQQLIDKRRDKIDSAADLFLDIEHNVLKKAYSTYFSLIMQQGHMMNKFLGDKEEADDHIYNKYKSQTQLHPDDYNENQMFRRINDDIKEFIVDVEDFDYDKEIGYVDGSSAMGVENLIGDGWSWKKINFI